jgi:predicted nucleic acid-binding protein
VRFLDTNVLLYSISSDPDEAEKRKRAIELIDGGDAVLSVQVLQEFYVQATRVTRADRLDHELATSFIRTWLRFPVVVTTPELLESALALCLRHRLSYWAAATVAAAASAGCEELLTEDLAHGAVLAGVRVVDPFR